MNENWPLYGKTITVSGKVVPNIPLLDYEELALEAFEQGLQAIAKQAQDREDVSND